MSANIRVSGSAIWKGSGVTSAAFRSAGEIDAGSKADDA